MSFRVEVVINLHDVFGAFPLLCDIIMLANATEYVRGRMTDTSPVLAFFLPVCRCPVTYMVSSFGPPQGRIQLRDLSGQSLLAEAALPPRLQEVLDGLEMPQFSAPQVREPPSSYWTFPREYADLLERFMDGKLETNSEDPSLEDFDGGGFREQRRAFWSQTRAWAKQRLGKLGKDCPQAELRAVRQKRDTLAGNAKQGERNAKRSCLRQAGLGGRSCQETADLPVDEEKVTIPRINCKTTPRTIALDRHFDFAKLLWHGQLRSLWEEGRRLVHCSGRTQGRH
ncbi:hypothetical protein AK812_SmicGene35561 [Symbiodinium microadriaticum]|uniref:Uncharacterized protein n=1 Tax=Symbiodinium microadriaticum TaxID=2951 RepID=A0A1Q9CL65_SYMMI|nr:hypothetical protein AK812_SmicGene35561 [Symbiodinium microadriaticum]